MEVSVKDTRLSSHPENNFASMETVPVLHVQAAMASRRPDLKPLYLLRENIRYLLDKRKESQTALAHACGHQKAWINKFLQDTKIVAGRKVPNDREVSIVDMGKIAEFFGLYVYQLFQPGISAMTERRTATDRRSGQERRIGHAGRQLATLRAEVDKVPRLASHDHAALRPETATARQILGILTDAVRRIAPLLPEARGQAATARLALPAAPRRRRAVRRSDSGKT